MIETQTDTRFTVRLTNFEGPFDLLLQLIGKHKLDVTEIALSRVTDEFIAHLKALGDELDLDQASEFLVVASTLLDLKAARLLPAAEIDDEEDLELLALETARLILRGQHGVAADRGRIVREAIAVLLADLEERGDDAVLVRRLRGK